MDSSSSDLGLGLDLQIDVLDPVLWLFIGILVTFLLTRLVTRRIRAVSNRVADKADRTRRILRNISIGGVHIHHQVIGILLMLGSGIGLIAVQPAGTALNATALVFGVGVSLAFDEFALWLHLDDVYWTPAGRKSVDAIFVVLAITGVLISGVDVFPSLGDTWGPQLGMVAVLLLSVVCLLKGKIATGMVGVVLFPVALVGALRLAKPDSWWSRRWYTGRARMTRRSRRRFDERYDARWNRLRDLVAGAPHLPSPLRRDARSAASGGPEVRTAVPGAPAPPDTRPVRSTDHEPVPTHQER
ncbi:hypothetical protein JL107_00235 [Nakamurella flavida]|uniref:Integral membrane protein n=1 Tax=Nakamurella flavida TaxID=363630 RepID=A0A938YGY3_9ACTN|nr:hypothetical protein [Nakamurella flavida]MBM9474864.1 hypothetical protein [Nakamurella flavida]MDP9776434.1 hypothetical protein [Nakamurella flavida]